MMDEEKAIDNHQAATGRCTKAQVLYDGQCPFCIKSVAILKRLDWFKRLQFKNARDHEGIPEHDPPLDAARLLEEMHLLPPKGGRLYHGFSAFRWLAWRLPLLWLVAPFLYLPGVPAVGQKIYLWVARHRFQLVPCHGGVCTVGSPSPPIREEKTANGV